MIKWIGQHIVDFIARFRSDVYLEDIADGTVVDNKFLGLDSNNKIVKEAASATVTDLHSAGVDGSANQLLTDDGDGTVTSEANATYGNDSLQLSSSVSGKPTLEIINSNTDAASPILILEKTAAGADNDYIGEIYFYGKNDTDSGRITFAKVFAQIADASDTDEAGKLTIQVATSNGTTSSLRNVLYAQGDPSTDDVDVTIGHGSTSTTTIGGNLNVNGTDHAFTSSTDNKPVVTLSCGGTAQVGSSLVFKRTATGADNTDIGTISFQGKNDADEDIYYAHMWADTADASDTDEAGTFNIQVACSDGSTSSLQNAFSATGTTPTGSQTEVDVNIGHGEFSKTNIAGSMTIGGADAQGDSFNITANSPTGANNNGATFKILGSAGNGTNKDGGILTLVGGASTGTGEGGRITLNGTPPGSSGSSVNSDSSPFDFYVGNTTPYLDIGPQSLGVRSFIDFNSETFENSIADVGGNRHCTLLRYAPAGTQSSLGVGEIYFLQTNGGWAQADASATSTGATQLLGVIAAGGALPSKGVVLEGFIRIPSNSILNTPGSGAVDGLPVYISTTAGHFDFTAPSGNNEYVRCVGYAIDDHSGDVLVYFKPDNTFVKITA